MANTAMAVVEDAPVSLPSERHRPALTGEDIDVLRATVLAGASDAQLNLFAISCSRRGLDPFSKEVYGFVNREGGVELVVSIEGLRKKAEESGQYMGQSQQQWCGADGEWQDIWLRNETPAAARITVHRAEHESFTGVALWKEFGKPGAQNWKQYPTVMLSKVAEANAIRHLFPNQTQGLYITEEVQDRAVEADHRVASGKPARRNSTAVAQPRRTVGQPQNGADAAKEHEEGWRLQVWEKVQELGLTPPQFNGLRRDLRLPLLEKMTVQQSKEIYQELLNWGSEPTDADPASGDPEEQAALEADFVAVSGESGDDEYS